MSKAKQERRAILVLGMHRSGTSALAAALQAVGVPLGDDLLIPGEDNPGGYFEHAAAVTAHEELLAELGRGWDDLRPLPDGWCRSEAAGRAARAIRELVAQPFASGPSWAVKDPRLCRVLPLWGDVLAAAGASPRYLIVVRHPDEVAASLARRNAFPLEYGHLLWLLYLLEAERDSRDGVRSVVTYDALLADPAACLRRIGHELGISWPIPPDAAALSGLLDPARRHHRATGADTAADATRAGNVALYETLASVNGAAGWPDLQAAADRLHAWRARHGPWLDAAGTALARARLGGLEGARAQRRMASALERVEALSLSRMHDLQVLDTRLKASDDALERAETHARAAQRDSQRLDARLRQADLALQAAKRLADEQQAQLHELDADLRERDAALAAAQALVQARTGEVAALTTALAEAEGLAQANQAALQALDADLRKRDAALAAAQALVQARTGEVAAVTTALAEAEGLAQANQRALQALDADLRQRDAALATAQALVRSRTAEVAALTTALAQAEGLAQSRMRESEALAQALAGVETLAFHRQHELHALDQRLRDMDGALAEAAALAVSRLEQLEALQRQFDEAARERDAARIQRNRLDEELGLARAEAVRAQDAARTRIGALESELAEREARIATLLASASWRVTRPLRWLAGKLGGSKRSQP